MNTLVIILGMVIRGCMRWMRDKDRWAGSSAGEQKLIEFLVPFTVLEPVRSASHLRLIDGLLIIDNGPVSDSSSSSSDERRDSAAARNDIPNHGYLNRATRISNKHHRLFSNHDEIVLRLQFDSQPAVPSIVNVTQAAGHSNGTQQLHPDDHGNY